MGQFPSRFTSIYWEDLLQTAHSHKNTTVINQWGVKVVAGVIALSRQIWNDRNAHIHDTTEKEAYQSCVNVLLIKYFKFIWILQNCINDLQKLRLFHFRLVFPEILTTRRDGCPKSLLKSEYPILSLLTQNMVKCHWGNLIDVPLYKILFITNYL